MGFITPSSVLNNVYAETLREWLLNNCRLDTIALTKEKVFADADVYTSVFVFEKNDNKAETNISLVRTTVELEKRKSNDQIKYSFINKRGFNNCKEKFGIYL